MIAPSIDALATAYSGRVKIGKLNVDENPAVAQAFAIRSIPTLHVFRSGKVADQQNGVPGRMQIQDDFPGGLGVQGQWSLQSGEEGRFALFFDFTTGSKITVKWGAELERSSDWTLAESHH
jgi:Thioredoxin